MFGNTAKDLRFAYVVALSAASISCSAIFYSVYGLSQLFAGASTAIIFMAGSLEVGKLVVASFLYKYWQEVNKSLRLYFTVACVILMLITSGGIYGFLSGAYQETAIRSQLLDKHVLVLQTKQDRFKDNLKDRTELYMFYSEALSNPTKIQYVDKETGQLVTTTSSRQRNTMLKQQDVVKREMRSFEDSVSLYDMMILDKQVSNESERELGPLKYIASTFGVSMDKVVNIFILLIVFVFDPLAVCLVIAANFCFSHVNITSIRKRPEKMSFKEWMLYVSKEQFKK